MRHVRCSALRSLETCAPNLPCLLPPLSHPLPRLLPLFAVGRHGPLRRAVVQQPSGGGTLCIHADGHEGEELLLLQWNPAAQRSLPQLASMPPAAAPTLHRCARFSLARRAAPTPPGRTRPCALRGGRRQPPAAPLLNRQRPGARAAASWPDPSAPQPTHPCPSAVPAPAGRWRSPPTLGNCRCKFLTKTGRPPTTWCAPALSAGF